MFCEESKATKDQKPDHWLFDESKYYLRVNGTPKYVPIQARCGKCVWLMEMELSVTVEQLAGHANTKDFRIEFKN
jgi:hypothetical protein